MAYFPIFINVENVKVLVIGLGCIAARRINVLKNFGAEITVITAVSAEETFMSAVIA